MGKLIDAKAAEARNALNSTGGSHFFTEAEIADNVRQAEWMRDHLGVSQGPGQETQAALQREENIVREELLRTAGAVGRGLRKRMLKTIGDELAKLNIFQKLAVGLAIGFSPVIEVVQSGVKKATTFVKTVGNKLKDIGDKAADAENALENFFKGLAKVLPFIVIGGGALLVLTAVKEVKEIID